MSKIRSSVLFGLAILILVVSCPVKRLLTLSYATQYPSGPITNQLNSTNKSIAPHANDASCFAKTANTALAKPVFAKQYKPVAPVFVSNIDNQRGYYLHAFLSTVNPQYCEASHLSYSSLPLFLQHRSLLI